MPTPPREPFEPFGGQFRMRRQSLARIKRRSWNRVVAHESWYDDDADGVPYNSHPAVCHKCAHRWVFMAPIGDSLVDIRCPSCKGMTGELAEPPYDIPWVDEDERE